jgi:hypothetical protein
MDAITRLQYDAILGDALDEALNLFGMDIKKILLSRLGVEDKNGNKINCADRDGNGSLDYKKLTYRIVQIFGSSVSTPVLLYLDQRIKERQSRMTKSN